MPQLDPSPWFSILMLAWFIFLAVIPLKILKYTFNKEPKFNTQNSNSGSWAWPWQ
uniref:ATP synthase complex subunit 8 n=1 Tax=Brycon argenteus TaxID=190787 RepID=Q71PY4_BRYAR|nr:ATPase synthase subunit 8 [Brycon argenteus]AAQ03390.1 ATPase synthase subunit 8 [Brycon argenteus]